jgi:5,5'-dehydrodivanillate O-demethylase
LPIARAAPRLPTADYTDFVHTGPGTLAGRYLRTFWQPVYVAADLAPGRAQPIRILGEDFTLYRGEGGQPHLVAFRCAHRGTQLSTGWVEGDQIRCFYHGWKYNGSGQCTEMPAEDASFPPKVRIASYPTEEYLGLIFAYLGEAEGGDPGAFRPPLLPRYPDVEGPGVVDASAYTRQCNYFNNVDNNVDPVHTLITHRDSDFSHSGLAGVPAISGEETAWGVAQYGTRADGEVRVTQHGMPTILHLRYYSGDPGIGWLDLLTWRVPVDDEAHWCFNVTRAAVAGEAADRYRARQAAARARLAALPDANAVAAAVLRGELRVHDLPPRPDLIAIQDHVAQCGQGVVADRAAERLGRSDCLVILLRQVWERELRALAEGRPLKQWTRPVSLQPTIGA